MRRLALVVVAALCGACSGTATAPGGSTGGSGATTASGESTGSSSGSGAGSGSSSGSSGSTGGCGTCAPGDSCGSANGHPVCRAPSGIPRFSHVFVIPMENTSWATLDADDPANTPFLHGLKLSAAYATDYHGVAHPSLPNYLAMVGGDDFGVGCDCPPTGGSCNSFSCNRLVHSCGCGQTGPSLGDQLDAANESWRAYAEDLPGACPTSDSGGFAVRHVPFLYFSGVTADASACAQQVVELGQLAVDLDANPRAFSFITPNLTDDMHDPAFPSSGPQNLANGDGWLAQEVPRITASAAFRDNGLLVIVWDEDDDSGGITGTDDPVPMFVLSPLAKTSYPSPTRADHYSLLATIEDGLGLPRLGKAQQATPLADFFPAR